MTSDTVQLKKRNEKLSRILEVGKVMSTQKDMDSLLETIISETSHILEADRTSLFIFDAPNRELWLKISEKHEISEIRFSIDKGIAGSVARTRQQMNIEDAYKHELFNPEIDQKTGYRTTSLLSAPLENLQGKLIGVIQVLNKQTGIFTKEDEEILSIFISFAAILLENSILAEDNLKKERMAFIGNMASNIIHDIKNPMTSIKGLAEIISTDSEENREHANIILKSANRILSMTEELLEFSRGIDKKIEFRDVDCQDFFTEVFSFVQHSLTGTKIQFKLLIETEGNISINQDKIQRAIYNITANAQDAMTQGGILSVDIKATDNNKSIIMVFADTGKGIPEQILKSVFEPFITYGKKNGTGLGMAITKKIIDAHKGSIDVRSTVSKGSCFRIILPRSQTH